MRGVCESFNQFIFEYDGQDKSPNDCQAELAKMLKLKFKQNAPRRPPRILIMGPPGSGRAT